MYEPGAALRKVYILITSQLFSRVITFVLNTLIARQVGLSVFGLVSVNFYLLDAIILMLAREGLY